MTFEQPTPILFLQCLDQLHSATATVVDGFDHQFALPQAVCGGLGNGLLVGEQPQMPMVKRFETTVGEVFVRYKAFALPAVDTSAQPVAYGVGQVAAPFGFRLPGEPIDAVFLVEGAVQKGLVTHVDVASRAFEIITVLPVEQCFV